MRDSSGTIRVFVETKKIRIDHVSLGKWVEHEGCLENVKWLVGVEIEIALIIWHGIEIDKRRVGPRARAS